jgi:hypothetical protein
VDALPAILKSLCGDKVLVIVMSSPPTKTVSWPADERKCVTCPAMLDKEDKEWAKQCYDCYRDKDTMRACDVCQEPKIPVTDEVWKRICAKCFTDSPMKPCAGCKEYKVKAVEKFRTLCKECWARKEEFLRICIECKDRVIPEKAQKWVKTCTTCYLNKKREKYEECPTCEGDLAKMLRKRKTAPACRDCMKGQNLIATWNCLTDTVKMEIA